MGSLAILIYPIIVLFTQDNDFLTTGFSWRIIVVRKMDSFKHWIFENFF